MVTSSNGNIFRVTGPLCGEFTAHRRIHHTRASDAELCFFSICAWINGWVNTREAGDLRCRCAHYDVIVIICAGQNDPRKIFAYCLSWCWIRNIPGELNEYHGYWCPGPLYSLEWRHYERDGVSNHQPYDCLLNRLFRRRSTKTSTLRVTGLCAGNSPGTGEFPHKGPVTRKMFPFNDVIISQIGSNHSNDYLA